jgi:hypothetical protein
MVITQNSLILNNELCYSYQAGRRSHEEYSSQETAEVPSADHHVYTQQQDQKKDQLAQSESAGLRMLGPQNGIDGGQAIQEQGQLNGREVKG